MGQSDLINVLSYYHHQFAIHCLYLLYDATLLSAKIQLEFWYVVSPTTLHRSDQPRGQSLAVFSGAEFSSGPASPDMGYKDLFSSKKVAVTVLVEKQFFSIFSILHNM